MASAHDITRHHEPDGNEDPWVVRPPKNESIEIVDYNPHWPARYVAIADEIRRVLTDTLLAIDHVGSTSVPGLGAKDVIDIDVTVADPSNEQRYVPPLESIGAQLTVREPSFHEHRMLRLASPRANIHVWAPDCPEVIRHSMFRDWLRDHPDDRDRYEAAKRAAVPGPGDDPDVMAYNQRKQDTIRDIYARMFRAAGLA